MFRKRAPPAVGEIKDRHVEHEHGVVPARRLSKELAPAASRYGLSVLSVAISTAATIPLQGFGVRVSLYFPAVLLSTWFGGTGPGLLAVLLSTLSINFFFTEPLLHFQFGVQDIPHT